jgi:hypothetical protein
VNGLKAAAPVSQSGDSISCSGLKQTLNLLANSVGELFMRSRNRLADEPRRRGTGQSHIKGVASSVHEGGFTTKRRKSGISTEHQCLYEAKTGSLLSL